MQVIESAEMTWHCFEQQIAQDSNGKLDGKKNVEYDLATIRKSEQLIPKKNTRGAK